MKLGSETNSLVNHVMATSVAPVPAVGDGATILGWTDRHPATVIKVERKGKSHYIWVQADHYKRIDNNGMSEEQEYEYAPDPTGSILTYRLYGDKRRLHAVQLNNSGKWVKTGNGGVLFGVRQKYHDFTF